MAGWRHVEPAQLQPDHAQQRHAEHPTSEHQAAADAGRRLGRRRRAAPGRWTTTGGKDAAALLRGGLVLQAAGVRGNTNKRVEARETTAFGPVGGKHARRPLCERFDMYEVAEGMILFATGMHGKLWGRKQWHCRRRARGEAVA
ncbi:hypothetical protein PF008_g26624 [Phytophthora fragariae]|uniref:Uncharacterized protein n=1 Tax=Phytophthora fragariae TaxID=53985 RepID=A0A6G0QGN7_9STRA|nr:hypothetical protein PF008_g26624 [Phytophthora fragariae]